MTQPSPVLGKVEVTPLVIADLQKRSDSGLQSYGVRLMTKNGRDALQDAYEEALDLACYLKQAIEERKAVASTALLARIMCMCAYRAMGHSDDAIEKTPLMIELKRLAEPASRLISDVEEK